MTPRDLEHLIRSSTTRPITRRELLKHAGLLGIIGVPLLTAACGGSAGGATQPTASATPPNPALTPTPPAPPTMAMVPATPAATTANTATATGTTTAGSPAATGTATTVNVEAYEGDNGFFFRVDKLEFPAGKVTFAFKNTSSKMNHELWVYPVQDLSTMLTLKRADQDATETDYLKGLAGHVEDVEPGKTATFDTTLEPGFYELACFLRGKNPDGTTFVHFDKGQSVTVAATGPSGLTAAVGNPAGTLSVVMTGDPNGSWVFVPDRLEVTAGDVGFKATNQMKMNHDFLVYPLGDISGFIPKRLAGQEDYSLIKGELLFEDLPIGQSAQKTKTLTPGMWVAACFITSKNPDGTTFIHRDRGQRITFLVK